MKFVDRLLTIVITATVTSMIWIVAGGSLMEMADGDNQRSSVRPAEAAPSPEASSSSSPATTEGSGESTSLDEDGPNALSEADARTLTVPVLNVRPSDLTDTYSVGLSEGESLHEALDIMAPEGTTVIAAAPGTIEELHTSEAGGKTIYVRSADKMTVYYYAHLQDYADGLRKGQRVRRGQRLGTVGSTGHASADAPHLHFAILRTTADAEFWEPANAVNPYPLLTSREQ